MQPPAHIITGWPSCVPHLVVATAAAQATRPTRIARCLPLDGALGKPVAAFHMVDTFAQRAHTAHGIIHEAMASRIGS